GDRWVRARVGAGRHGGDHAGGARAGGPQPRDAARSAALPDHAGRPALPADPLRHPGDGSGLLPPRGRRAGRAAAEAVAGRPARPPAGDASRHDGMRRQRPRPLLAALDQPAMADRGGRDRRVDGNAARAAAAGGRHAGRCGRRRVHRRRSRRRGRRDPGLPARADAGGGHGRRRPARPRAQRRAIAAPARVPAAARRPRLVRHDERQVARPDRRGGRAVRGLPAHVGLPPLRGGRHAGRARDPHGPALAHGSAGNPGLHDPRALRRAGAVPARRARVVGLGARRARRGQRGRRARVGRGGARPADRAAGVAGLELPVGAVGHRPPRALLARDGRGGQRPARHRRLEPQGLREHVGGAHRRVRGRWARAGPPV
ncbi:MAG: Sulfur oxidation protein SoxC, partial [uncultured Thermoleophilia bacterium]